MKFKISDKVKLTKTAFERVMRFNPSYRGIKNAGVVVCEGNRYTKVDFQHPQRIWWISNKSLELIRKNQQLLFNFME